jgi:hypothetical protein
MLAHREYTGNWRRSVYDEITYVGWPVDFPVGETRFGEDHRNAVLRFHPAPKTAL